MEEPYIYTINCKYLDSVLPDGDTHEFLYEIGDAPFDSLLHMGSPVILKLGVSDNYKYKRHLGDNHKYTRDLGTVAEVTHTGSINPKWRTSIVCSVE